MDPTLEKKQVSQTDSALRNTSSNNDAGIYLSDPQMLSGDDKSNIRLDNHKFSLVPQPTQHKDDPLVSQTSIHPHRLK
jgi:hypothetical protein